ncbi:MAG: DUF3343 domain-containing protein [Clostridiaceae bacterium]
MNHYCLVVFKNTIGAIQGEKELKQANLDVSVMPTPSVITGSCGVCIRFNEGVSEKVKKVIEDKNIQINGIYRKSEEGYVRL